MEEGDIVDVVAGSAANEAVLRKQAERGNYQCPFHGCFFPGCRGALHTACPLVKTQPAKANSVPMKTILRP
jgi:hypothetical protein